MSEAILALIHERAGDQVKACRLNAEDTYVPLGPAADWVLPLEADVVRAALALAGRSAAAKPTLAPTSVTSLDSATASQARLKEPLS